MDNNCQDFPSLWLLMGYVEGRPWWPIQSPNNGRKKKVKGEEKRERDEVEFIDLRFERLQVVGLSELC